MDCLHCGASFQRSRPDANREKYCSLKCRLLSGYIESPSGCWEWARAIFKQTGYGAINVNRKIKTTHRVAYELLVGPVPPDLNVLHRCDNRLCINPAHLFLGTQTDNIDDMLAKGRGHWSQWSKERRDEQVKRLQDGQKARRAADMMRTG